MDGNNQSGRLAGQLCGRQRRHGGQQQHRVRLDAQLNTTGGTSTFSGVIAGGSGLGTINLVLSGSGTQVLAGWNTYTGGTTINGGNLRSTARSTPTAA